MRKNLTAIVALALSFVLAHSSASAKEVFLTGRVFEDSNSNGAFDQGESPLPGTAVSDGRDVVVTDSEGRYRIGTEADIIFVSVPGSHHAANNQYYQRIESDGGAGQTSDFPLIKNESTADDDTFTFAFVTDTHAADYRRAKEGIAKAYGAVSRLNPALVIHGGDIIFDALKTANPKWAEAQYKLYKNELAPIIKPPFYHSVGNHDVFAWVALPNPDPAPPLYGKRMFEKYFGPAYYSFNYKHCHFIVIDSLGKTKTDSGEPTYHGFIDDVQLEWLKKDLGAVDSEAPIIVVTHIPMINALASMFGTRSEIVPGHDGVMTPKHQIQNMAKILGEVLRQRNFRLALAGHYHTFEEIHWKSNEHDTRFIVGGSICGEWWKGDHRLGLSSWAEGFTLVNVDGDNFAASYVPYGWKGTEEQ
jgi:hypothetical protein